MTRNLLFAAAVLLMSSLIVTAAVDAQYAKPGAQAVVPVRPMKPAPPGPLPPIPFERELARPVQIVQAVYEFAARHPEVLQYVPCYCGCESLGHNGNHECFVKSRAADGRVTAWEPHGSGCTICVDVARDAMLMFNSGASVSQIRDAIDQKWGTRFPSHTPTPVPARPAQKPARG